MTGGASPSRQRDRLFSLSVRRLDVVIGRLLPDGERLPDGELCIRTLGGETTIDVAGAHDAWDRPTSACVPAPEPPGTDLTGYDAFVAGLPPRFWTRDSDSEIEYVGLLGAR